MPGNDRSLTPPPRLPIPDPELPRRERRFPYRPADDAEAQEVRAEFDLIARDYDGMIWQAIRRKIHDRAQADEAYACVLWRLWRSALPAYDTTRAGLGTMLYVAIRRAIIDYIRRRKAPRERHFDGSELRTLASDTRLDRHVEAVAQEILDHPDLYASPREAQVIADVRDHPGAEPVERGRRLGMTSRRVNTVMVAARKRIRGIDVEDFQVVNSAGSEL